VWWIPYQGKVKCGKIREHSSTPAMSADAMMRAHQSMDNAGLDDSGFSIKTP
jgi:hypothetical protein